ncbi:hypothetical protein GCM10027199_80530 [Amycolatopsis magusensis]
MPGTPVAGSGAPSSRCPSAQPGTIVGVAMPGGVPAGGLPTNRCISIARLLAQLVGECDQFSDLVLADEFT